MKRDIAEEEEEEEKGEEKKRRKKIRDDFYWHSIIELLYSFYSQSQYHS